MDLLTWQTALESLDSFYEYSGPLLIAAINNWQEEKASGFFRGIFRGIFRRAVLVATNQKWSCFVGANAGFGHIHTKSAIT